MRKCNKYFAIYQVSDTSKIELVELYLDGKVDIWFQSLKMVKGRVTWSEFSEALVKRFGNKEDRDEVEEFNMLVQTDSVLEYQEKFEELRSLLLCRDPRFYEQYFISSFISRLKEELRPMVRLMKPQSLLEAFEVAQLQEIRGDDEQYFKDQWR